MTWTEIQHGLADALAANRPGSGIPHVLVSLPSFSLGESLLRHYGDRLPSLEHRYLLAIPLLARVRDCEMVFVCSVAPSPEVLDYCFSLLPASARSEARRRFHVLDVGDTSIRGVAAKLLDRPDLLERLRSWVGDRPAFIDPWNVTEVEVRLAEAVALPLNGTAPDLWHLGFKSAGRRLLREAGVPVADGAEDVRTIDGVLHAIDGIRARRPGVRGVVIKTDDSGAGDGNRVIRLGGEGDDDHIGNVLDRLPAWYLDDLSEGAVVEELVCGDPFSSPSVQVDLLPDGPPRVLATHEQVLGGEDAQVYLGCRFPADDAYAARLGEYGVDAGERLTALGAIGRISIDFAVGRSATGGLQTCALEVNLRKGGTTHPYAALRNLVPGRYDIGSARWVVDADGSHRFYEATDNLVEPDWVGRDPSRVIERVRAAGLQFDHESGTGVVLHMLSCLAVDGRMGLTAIGTSRAHAADLFAAASLALHA